MRFIFVRSNFIFALMRFFLARSHFIFAWMHFILATVHFIYARMRFILATVRFIFAWMRFIIARELFILDDCVKFLLRLCKYFDLEKNWIEPITKFFQFYNHKKKVQLFIWTRIVFNNSLSIKKELFYLLFSRVFNKSAL
jgi:hypothetical protein